MTNIPHDGSTVNLHPIARVLDLLPDAKGPNAQGFYQAHCPAHNDGHRSLSFKEVGDGVYFACFAFCQRSAILSALNLDEDKLRINGSTPKGASITTLDLAIDKRIHWKYLMELGLIDIDHKGVKIPYYTMDGTPYERERLRTHLIAKEGSFWNEGTAPLIPYGLEKLEEARQAKRLVIVEGESDCWTLWLHKYPALGIPGANNIACLQSEHIADIESIFVIQEPGAAGKKFPLEIKKRLDKIGYKGRVYALDLKSECDVKDPNDLHKKDAKAFQASFEQALLHAKPLHREIPKLATYQLCELQKETLPETRWAIEPILPEGVTILGGKPKLGKSWLALSIQMAISSGGVALGQYAVEQGQVLYVALEDNKKRLKKRSNIMLQNAQASPDFFYTTVCNRIDEGGREQIEGWIQDHPHARLICIDTWARFKPRMHGGRNNQQYDEDYEALAPLQEMAGKYGVSILIVDHMRKMESEDPIDMISGSVGKAGAVDGFLLLYRTRGETDARLYVTGRDIEMEYEKEYQLEYVEQCASWVIKGETAEFASTPERQVILDVLKASQEPMTMKEIASKLPEKKFNTIRNLMVRLRDENKVLLQNNAYSVVTRSQDSQRSQRSQRSQTPDLPDYTPDLPDYADYAPIETVVRADDHVSAPVEPKQNGHASPLTTLTTVTTHAKQKRDDRGFFRLCQADKCTWSNETAHNGLCKKHWQEMREAQEVQS